MQNPILSVLRENKAKLFPVMGTKFKPEDYCEIDLSIYNTEFEVIDVESFEGLADHIHESLVDNDAKVGIGGYGENRPIYRSSTLYSDDPSKCRCIHLGIDVWTEVQSKVFCPLDGIVHSFHDNNKELDYGGTIILEHKLAGAIFYTLYGHLSTKSLDKLEKGKKIEKGTCFAKLGPREENGGWPPHLHFQLILDMLGMDGDFPGVATELESAYYMDICPNPAVFFEETGVFDN
ncbi:MAG: peptidoglycan DD-metalloendopeptidase family protein [Saprospiraceae bacterium]